MRAYPFTGARKTTGVAAWDEQVYSQQKFSGGAYASARVQSNYAMFGLNFDVDPSTTSDFNHIYFAWFVDASNNLQIYESGVSVGTFGTWAVGDLLEILYWFDGANWAITYLHNGVAIRGLNGPAGGGGCWFDSSFYQFGELLDIRFGPNSGQVSGTFTASAGISLVHGVWPQLAGAGYDIHLQSESQDADGVWQSHNTLQGTDWQTSFKYKGDADSNIVTGSLELARADRALSMAPLITGSAINRKIGGTYAPFLDVGRRVRVRNAIMPKGVAPYSGIGGTWSSSGVSVVSVPAFNDGVFTSNAFHTDSAVPGAYIQVDMGALVEFDQVRLWQATSGGPANWTVQGSFNGTTWVNIRTGFVANLTGPNVFYFPRSLYRYWRLTLANTPGGGPWTNEVQFNRDWREIFDGYIDKVGVGARDSNAIGVDCRDLGALLVDTDIEVVRQYGSSGGTPVETVMQSILDDNLGAGVVTLYTPVSPTWQVHEFSQKLTSVMDAIRTLAKQIGYEVRYLYDANNVLRLTFYAPDRAKVVSDYAIAPTVYTDVTSLDVEIADVRNAWTVEYIDRATGNKLTAIATSAPSIAQFKRRPAKIAYGYSSNIDSATEAQKMVNAALADTAFPKAIEVIDASYLPVVDIADLITLIANGEHYDKDQQRAIVAWEHDLHDGDGTTTLTTRGSPGGGYTTWMSMVGGILDGPSLVVMDTPGANPAANHSVSYTGSWDTIQLSINGAAWIVPGASPLTVTPNPAGGATKVYSFRAIKNGQIVTQNVSIEPPAPLPPQALITHLNSEVDDTQWFLQVNAVIGSGGGGTNLTWATFKKIGFVAEAAVASGNATTLPAAATVARDPRSDTVFRLTVTDALTGLTHTTRLTVPSQRPEIDNSGHPHRNHPWDDGDYGARSPANTGLVLHTSMVDSRASLVNTMHRIPVDTLDNVLDGGTYSRPLGSRISAGKPLIDFSEAIHIAKNLGNIPDTTSRFASPVPNATSDIVLVPSAGIALGGNSAAMVSGTAWNEQVYSGDGFTGGAYASVTATGGQSYTMFGLNVDPTLNASYTSIDYAIYLVAGGTVDLYFSGVSQGLGGVTWVNGDVFVVLYDGSVVKFLKNGVPFGVAQYVGPGVRYFFDSSFNDPGSRLAKIKFGPMTTGMMNASDQVIRGLVYNDSAYALKSNLSDGRRIGVSDTYDEGTGQYMSSTYFRGYHTLDYISDGATWRRPTGVNASNLITPPSTIGRGTILGYKTNSQTIASSALTSMTQLTLDNAAFALGTGITRSTNQLLINDAVAAYGVWVFVAQVGFAGNATGDRHVELRKNNTAIAQTTVRACASASNPTIIPVISFQSSLALSDAFDAYVSQDSGSSIAIRLSIAETFLAAIHLW